MTRRGLFDGETDLSAERERRIDRDFHREPRRARQTSLPPFASHASFQGAAAPKSLDATRCYACDARAIGTRDRRAEGGRLERACVRHADSLGAAGVLHGPVGQPSGGGT